MRDIGSQRDTTIDALKGLAIVLVVVGHAIPQAAASAQAAPGLIEVAADTWVPARVAAHPLFELIYAFHMPLFAFLSGFVLWRPEQRPVRARIERRTLGLLVPYFAWFAVFFVIAQVLGTPYSGGFARSLLTVATVVPSRGGLWYLYALFVSSMLLLAIGRSRRARWLLPLTAGGAVFARMLPVVRTTSLFGATVVTWTYPFVVLGYVVAAKRDVIAERLRRLTAPSLVGFGALFAALYPLDVPDANWLSEVCADLGLADGVVETLTTQLMYPLALAGVVAAYGLYHFLGHGWIIDWHAWLGRRTLGIYAIHGLALQVGLMLKIRDWTLLSAAALVMSVLATLVLERTPVLRSLLLGRDFSPKKNASAGGTGSAGAQRVA